MAVVLKHNTEQNNNTHNTSFHSKYYIVKMPSIRLLTPSKPTADHNSWRCVTQEEILTIPVDVLRSAMSCVQQ
jgi:hypothetical protein